MAKETFENALKEMDAYLLEAFNEHVLPGLAVGVVQDGRLVYSKTFGYAHLEHQEPVTLDTIFRIMSISKTFTAIGIMQLWEQKKFDLDDPVNPFLKSLKVTHKDPEAPQITFRHMLTHTSGIGEMRGLRDLLLPIHGLGAHPDTPILSMPEYFNGELRAEIYPGQKWSYANLAYGVLAQLIEDISGQPFALYMREHVFEPLGMLHSDYFMSERVRDELAQGYQFKKDRFEPVEYLRLNTPGCGGIFSSVNDMVHYVSALMNGGKLGKSQILQAETLKLMMTPQLDTDLRIFGMGLGFVLSQYGPHRVARHGGGWPGFITEMSVVPEQNLAVLVFNNSSSGAPGLIAKGMLYRLLGLPEPAEQIPNSTILENPSNWAHLVGSYGPKPGLLTNFRVWNGFGGEVEVYVKNNKLMLRGLTGPYRKGFPLHRADPEDELLFMGKSGKQVSTVLFETDAAGNVDRLNLSSYVFYKRPFQQSLRFKALTALGALGGALLGVLGRALFRKRKS